MGPAIAALVAFGFIVYLAATFVGVGDDPEPVGLARAAAPLRSVLDGLLAASPIFLAVIWIGYGLLHLRMPELGPTEIPMCNADPTGSANDWCNAIWNGSGAFEIVIGGLVVHQRWRRWALLAQLLMLVALTPFVIYILGEQEAITKLLVGISPALGRIVLVFHNLLLFVWTARVYRDELKHSRSATQRESSGADQPPGGESMAFGSAKPSTNRKLEPVLIVATVMLAANLAGCLVIGVGPWRSGSLYLWAMGSLATGGLLGFLFGVPRWVAPEKIDGRVSILAGGLGFATAARQRRVRRKRSPLVSSRSFWSPASSKGFF